MGLGNPTLLCIGSAEKQLKPFEHDKETEIMIDFAPVSDGSSRQGN